MLIRYGAYLFLSVIMLCSSSPGLCDQGESTTHYIPEDGRLRDDPAQLLNSDRVRNLDLFVNSFQSLVGADSTRLPEAYPDASATASGSASGGLEKSLPGYPLLATRSPVADYGVVRTSPGLASAMTEYQRGNVAGAVQTLKDTLGQVDQALKQNPKLVEGRQVASTRNALQLGETALAKPTSENLWNAMDANNASDGAGDPILLDMNGNGIADVMSLDVSGTHRGFRAQGAVFFDLSGQGRSSLTEWLKPGEDGLLGLDVNGNGVVDTVSELFGDQDGFADGFAKLALLDTNSDGVLTGEELSRLVVWIDRNGDGVCQSNEASSVSSVGITSISVRQEGYRSSFVRNGKSCQSWDWFPRMR